LHGVVKFSKAPRHRKKNLIFLMTWRLHGVFRAIMALLQSFNSVKTRSYGVLIGDCLRLDCASSVFDALLLRFHSASTALSQRSHGALAAFTLRLNQASYTSVN
jgi:hypothetical protein